MHGNSAQKKTNVIQKRTGIIKFVEGFMCFVSSSLKENPVSLTLGEGAQVINANKKEEVSSASESSALQILPYICVFPCYSEVLPQTLAMDRMPNVSRSNCIFPPCFSFSI